MMRIDGDRGGMRVFVWICVRVHDFFFKDAHKHRVVLWQINASSDRGSILHRSTVQRQLTMDTDNTTHYTRSRLACDYQAEEQSRSLFLDRWSSLRR